MSESSQEKGETRRSQRLLEKATAATAEAKYSSDPSVENIPSVRPRKSVRSPSRTESLPSGLVKSKVRRTPVPQSKQIKSYPSSEGREYIGSYPSSEARNHPSSERREHIGSYPSSEARSYPSSEVIKSEIESYKVEESESDLSEQFQFEPSTAEFSAREIPIQQYDKFEAPEEKVFYNWRPPVESPLSPIPEITPA